jgi:fibronectin type 3 domain-containing protein
MRKLCFLVIVLLELRQAVLGQSFIHPGGLHTLADLNRIQTNVLAGNHPWIDDWNVLITDSQAQSNYSDHATSNMGSSRQNADLDAHAAYLNTIRWYISGNVNYANEAVKICNDWSARVNQVSSGTDVPGLIGIPIAHFAEVGELLRIYPGWSAASFQAYTNMMVQYLYPSCNSFLTTHNGACISSYWANWDACNLEALIAMGVLCDNTNFYDQGVNYFESGDGMGSISNAVQYLYDGGVLGQWQESGRDQEHAQLGVGELGAACQTAWNQGLNLFSFGNNRLLAGAEYVAHCNLSYPIPSIPFTYYDNCANSGNCYLSINGIGRLDDRPVWELLYNHYVVLQGLTATNVQAMAQAMRPEHGSIDHFGYGTLTFTLNAADSPYPPSPVGPAPAGLTATPGVSQVFLNWAPSSNYTAQGYVVRRSTSINGTYSTITSWNAETSPQYVDTTAVNGTTYYYEVAATNQSGTGAYSAPASATPQAAGSLPAAWSDEDIGAVGLAGSGTYSGVSSNTFIVSGAGSGISGTADSFNFANAGVTGNFTLIAQLAAVNWSSSGADDVGIMMRETLSPNAKAAVVTLGNTGDRECYFGTRTSTGGSMSGQLGNDYTWTPVWFKLQRVGNIFSAYQSLDGNNWFEVGSPITMTMSNTYYVGLAVTANSTTASDTTTFNNVTTNGVVAITEPPTAPTGLWASASAANAQIVLNWAASVGATSNNIWRALASGGPYTNIATVGAVAAYTDANVVDGTPYFYEVNALDNEGASATSASVEAIPNNPLSGSVIGTSGSWNNDGDVIADAFDSNLNTFFDGPDSAGDWAGLDFGAGVSNVINQIAYCPRPSYAARLEGGMFQGCNASNFTNGVVTLFTVPASAPALGVFTFQPVTNFTAFRYVRYLGPANGNCNVAEVKFFGNSYAASLPAVPANLSAVAGNVQVTLNWNAAANATGYNVWRSTTNGGPYTLDANVSAADFIDTGLADGTVYYYVVSATNGLGASANSSQIAAQPVSTAPVGLSFLQSGSALGISWPQDHTGWVLQTQTNSLATGLSTNWVDVGGTSSTNAITVPINSANGSIFFRLIYP